MGDLYIGVELPVYAFAALIPIELSNIFVMECFNRGSVKIVFSIYSTTPSFKMEEVTEISRLLEKNITGGVQASFFNSFKTS